MQVDVVFEDDGAGQEDAFRHDEVSPALLVEGRHRLAERLGIHRHAIGHSAIFRQGNLTVGNDNRGRNDFLCFQGESSEKEKDRDN